jgi:hypothetical protein
MYGNLRPGRRPAAAQENGQILRRLLERARRQGRLRVPVETAARHIEASTTGAILLLLSQPESDRDPSSLVGLCDTVIASIVSDAGPAGDEMTIAGRALALLAALGDGNDARNGDPVVEAGFSPAEAVLLREWIGTLTR